MSNLNKMGEPTVLDKNWSRLREVIRKNSRIWETPTLLTDADSRTDTILERLRDLPIRTEKQTWSTRKCGLGPRYGGDSVHAKMLTLFTPEHIPVFRALLEIKIEIEMELRNTSSLLGLYSRSNSGTHPCFLGLYSRSRLRSNSGTHPRF